MTRANCYFPLKFIYLKHYAFLIVELINRIYFINLYKFKAFIYRLIFKIQKDQFIDLVV